MSLSALTAIALDANQFEMADRLSSYALRLTSDDGSSIQVERKSSNVAVTSMRRSKHTKKRSSVFAGTDGLSMDTPTSSKRKAFSRSQ